MLRQAGWQAGKQTGSAYCAGACVHARRLRASACIAAEVPLGGPRPAGGVRAAAAAAAVGPPPGRRARCAHDKVSTTLYFTTLCYTIPCHAMLCHAMLCHAMLCYAMRSLVRRSCNWFRLGVLCYVALIISSLSASLYR
jgi:hypothetical protein